MFQRVIAFGFVLSFGLGSFAGKSVAETPTFKISAEAEAFFESKIRPLLVEHCYECHSSEGGEGSGELLLDSGPAMRAGGVSGPSLVPGLPEKSLLIKAVRYKDSNYQMPPEGKLDESEIELLERWVEMGAPDPRREPSSTHTSKSPTEIDPSDHWAFEVPNRFDGDLIVGVEDRDLIDSIARQVADSADLEIVERCDSRELVRRLYYDLTGLPPDKSQIDAFVESDDPIKLERLVDELLASPAYAERFARHWMDVARYADTIGYALAGKERRLKGSERYREWVIRAFADDLPFDQMIRYQLAADRFDPENLSGHLDAMGFLTVGRRFLNRFDTIDDRIDVITRGLMGLTVTCARCHDHKFDPIPAQDYYSLLGILQSSESRNESASPLALFDKPKPKDSYVFRRGQPGNRGESAPRQYLTVLRDEADQPFRDGSGRLELAEKLASPTNPLVPRVYVNRVWMHLIGRPIVDSTSDFGVRTEAPPLAEVLDELSAEFATHWSTKRLVKRIVLSRVYAQSSNGGDEASRQADADNMLAARGNRRRKDFESYRDSILSACGLLDVRIGGVSVDVHLNSPSPRRSLYAMIDRQNLPSLFRTFDLASPDTHAPKRLYTTVPQQALFLMNHPQMGVLSRTLADQIRGRGDDLDEQVDRLFARIYSRAPTASERETCVSFLRQPASGRVINFDPAAAWSYGTTPVDEKSRVTDFRPFPVFSGGSWQDQLKLPASSVYSYASLADENGHPGPKHAVVRRWTAPADGVVSLSGMVGHRNQQGDGIELAVWIGDQLAWREDHKGRNYPFGGLRGLIQKGQHVDFVTSPRGSDSFDSFFLKCQVSLRTGDGRTFEGDSKRDFSGPVDTTASEPLDRLAQLVQTLLLSNEFAFVD